MLYGTQSASSEKIDTQHSQFSLVYSGKSEAMRHLEELMRKVLVFRTLDSVFFDEVYKKPEEYRNMEAVMEGLPWTESWALWTGASRRPSRSVGNYTSPSSGSRYAWWPGPESSSSASSIARNRPAT